MGDRVTVNRAWISLARIIRLVETLAPKHQPRSPRTPGLAGCEVSRKRPSPQIAASTIVTSAIYQQSSQASPEQLQRDPENRHLVARVFVFPGN